MYFFSKYLPKLVCNQTTCHFQFQCGVEGNSELYIKWDKLVHFHFLKIEISVSIFNLNQQSIFD